MFFLYFLTRDFSIVFGQIAQQVFVAEEWVHDACNEAEAEALSRDVEKSLKALKQEKVELSEKLKATDQARLNADRGKAS